IRSGRADFDAFTASIKNGHDTIEQATADTRSWGKNWQIFKNQLTLALEQLGVSLVQGATKALNAVKPRLAPGHDLTEWFSKLPLRAQDTALAIAGLAAAIGPMVAAAGGLGFAIQGITGALKALGLTATETAAAELAEGAAAAEAASMHTAAAAESTGLKG